MNAGNCLRLVMVLAGVLILLMTLTSLAKRKFTDGFCMLWGMLSVCMILGGILLSPVEIGKYISNTGLMIVLIAGFGILAMAWGFSRELSALQRQNHELAMQISLLNQESIQMRQAMKEISSEESAPPNSQEQISDKTQEKYRGLQIYETKAAVCYQHAEPGRCRDCAVGASAGAGSGTV